MSATNGLQPTELHDFMSRSDEKGCVTIEVKYCHRPGISAIEEGPLEQLHNSNKALTFKTEGLTQCLGIFVLAKDHHDNPHYFIAHDKDWQAESPSVLTRLAEFCSQMSSAHVVIGSGYWAEARHAINAVQNYTGIDNIRYIRAQESAIEWKIQPTEIATLNFSKIDRKKITDVLEQTRKMRLYSIPNEQDKISLYDNSANVIEQLSPDLKSLLVALQEMKRQYSHEHNESKWGCCFYRNLDRAKLKAIKWNSINYMQDKIIESMGDYSRLDFSPEVMEKQFPGCTTGIFGTSKVLKRIDESARLFNPNDTSLRQAKETFWQTLFRLFGLESWARPRARL